LARGPLKSCWEGANCRSGNNQLGRKELEMAK
jgi:hypothetical protein